MHLNLTTNVFLSKCRKAATLYLLTNVLCGIACPVSGHAQSILDRKISLQADDVSLKGVLSQIHDKTAIKFVYSSNHIALDRKVSASANQEELGKVLDKLLAGLDIAFVATDDYIVLKENHQKPTASGNYADLQVKGKILSESGEPFPGATIVEKGTSNGTVSGPDGSFSIKVKEGAILVITAIGYDVMDVKASEAGTIRLKAAVKQLQDIVVTAAGIARQKTSLGYSVSTVSSDKLAQKSEPDPVRALTGKVAGVNIQSAGGVAGGGTNITIRGNSSLNGNNQPLFVVDGVPFDNSSFANVGATTVGGVGVTNRAFDLDPNNIQSMTVLKGAAAAALYGSRAANGAIIITTKAGKKKSRKGTEITYNTGYSFEQVSGLPEYQTKYGQGTNNDYRQGVYASWGQPFEGVQSIIPTRKTIPHQLTRQFSSAVFPQFYEADGVTPIQVPYKSYARENVKNFFRTGSVYENAITISSGSEKGNFNAGFSDTRNTGVVPGNDINRTSVNIGGNIKLDNKFYASGSINYVITRQKTPPIGGLTGSIMSTLMYVPTSYDLTNYPYENPLDGSNVYDYTGIDNPYWSVKHSPSTSAVDRYYGNLVLGFDPLPWLNVQNTIGFNAYTDRRVSVRGKGSSSYPNGSITTDNIYRQELDNTLLLTATKSLTPDWNLKVILGNNVNQRLTDRKAFYGDNIIVADLVDINNTSSVTPIQLINNRNLLKQRYYAFFTDITLDYKNFASLNLVGRNDISSTLPANNRSYFYGGVNGSLIFTEALPMSKAVLNFGKIRAGYTRVGNEASPYQTQNFYQINPVLGASSSPANVGLPFTPPGGSTYNVVTLANLLTNANLKPEFITELELGTELQFFQNRIGIDFTWYNKKSTSQIFEVTAAPSSGYMTQILNLGEATNKGIEIGFTGAPLRSATGLNWDISANFTRNRNIIQNLGGYERFSYGGTNGTSSVHIVGQPYGLIQGTAYARDDEGNVLIDPNTGKPLIAGSLKPIGNPNPDFIFGITNSFHFKNFSLNILFDWKQGGQIFSRTVAEMLSRGVTRDMENREFAIVSPGVLGDINTQTPLLDDKGNKIPNNVALSWEDHFFSSSMGPGNGGINEGSVFDATVFRLREIALGYDIPKSFLGKTPFGAASISFTGRNLWYKAPNFPKYTHFDPEVSSLGVGNSQGYDNLAVPTTKRFGVNLKCSF
ncbi:TonB-linked SusC/RagA family outer membrane protein [Chitinophaga terrae (ex Kim and Jung 2007)]|jgi:TonB-linked SusC/RagA family outer membrane protein|uniref:SusC/RagA family TonB-linked outer membrane protein n=1 Tax=Chitinophaga terrae (ex Kim and Jung 2007) TaxID=408074 RepID=UPI0027881BF6|nr:SusC/RagA family TonB-linked outer membrane protein [Chitinophaga terrae (ex Kim and Jung 2007)]MDQ0106186.1 TonB-linked SusC/RagA family outer membrane protein [Chitinophaga terrae (ex Kim and Jung 2007)]